MSIVLYYIPILLCAVTPFFKELSDSRKWYVCLGIYLCLFYCFGYMTGSDWKVYEDFYCNLDFIMRCVLKSRKACKSKSDR